MAKICVEALPFLDRQVVKVTVPATTGAIKQGAILKADSLKVTPDNQEVYEGAKVTADDPISTVIVYNQDVYTDAYGNKVQGMVNPDAIKYAVGKVISAVRPEMNTKIKMTNDCIKDGATLVKDDYVVIDTTEGVLKGVANASLGAEKLVLQVEQVLNTAIGAVNGLQTFEPTLLLRVVKC